MTKYLYKRNNPVLEFVDGPFAGRTFVPGQRYDAIPPGHEGRFEEIQPSGAVGTNPAKGKTPPADTPADAPAQPLERKASTDSRATLPDPAGSGETDPEAKTGKPAKPAKPESPKEE